MAQGYCYSSDIYFELQVFHPFFPNLIFIYFHISFVIYYPNHSVINQEERPASVGLSVTVKLVSRSKSLTEWVQSRKKQSIPCCAMMFSVFHTFRWSKLNLFFSPHPAEGTAVVKCFDWQLGAFAFTDFDLLSLLFHAAQAWFFFSSCLYWDRHFFCKLRAQHARWRDREREKERKIVRVSVWGG